MFKLILVALVAIYINATSLNFSNGKIKAHTEVFGDSTINPISRYIKSKLNISDSIESLKGTITVNTLSFYSDNKKRDEHMYQTLQSTSYPTISFKIESLKQVDKMYEIKGQLTLNGITKEISSLAKIEQDSNHLVLDGNFSFLLTSFNLEPPTMFFLTVRDKINITYHLFYLNHPIKNSLNE